MATVAIPQSNLNSLSFKITLIKVITLPLYVNFIILLLQFFPPYSTSEVETEMR